MAVEPVRREYAKLAGSYDKRWASYIQGSIEITIRHLGPHLGSLSGARVLDVGCGTGALLAALRGNYPNVTLAGIDLSPDMLAMAGDKLGPSVTLEQAGAEALPFPDEAFDLVVSTSVFHFIRQPLAALGQITRVLKPNGRVVITDWCDDYLACRICDLFLRIFNPAHFRTYGRQEMRRMMTEAGFIGIDIDADRVNWFWGFMTASATKPAP